MKKIPKNIVTDLKPEAPPSRRENDQDLLTIEAEELNRGARPMKDGWPLKIITPRAYPSNQNANQHAKIVLKK